MDLQAVHKQGKEKATDSDAYQERLSEVVFVQRLANYSVHPAVYLLKKLYWNSYVYELSLAAFRLRQQR